MIDKFTKIFVNEAIRRYYNNEYLYLTKKFRNEVYEFSLQVGFSCKYIIINIFKYYDVINLKEIIDNDKVYLKIEVFDKINNINYDILCDKDYDDDVIFTYDNFYNILVSEHNKYIRKTTYLKAKLLCKINLNPVIPQTYAHKYLQHYEWIHSQHFKYGSFSL